VTAGPSQDLLIIGAGGMAREVAQAAHAINDVAPTYRVLGHLDDDPQRHGRDIDGLRVLGSVDLVHDHPHALVVVATGRPSDYFSRIRLVRRLGLPDERFATVVHPAASLAKSVSLGPGCMVLATAVATAAVSLGRHVAVMPGVVVTHDTHIDDYVTLAAGALLAGGISVARGAYVGAGTCVREDLRVGRWSLVGMGSVVTRSVPDQEVWYGAPARVQGTVFVPHDVGDAA
jgi:sugar O-acyltransferase (sialic acid O-acetyltransferase NeuD family)